MTAIQKRNPAVASLSHYLTAKIPQLGEWVRDRIDPAALVRFALFEVQQSDQLQRCSPQSIYLTLLACAQVGLEPGGVKQEAFIVPFKGVATFQLGWRGIVKLAMRSGEVAKISANVVHQGDDFDFDLGTESFVRHRPTVRGRGEMIGAYAFAKLKTGELDVEWMDIADLAKIRNSSHEGPAWKTWADQMYRKAPIRRLGKRLPLGGDYMLGARLDELAEGGDLSGYHRAIESTGAIIDIDDGPGEVTPKAGGQGVRGAKKKLAAARASAPEESVDHGPDPIDVEVALLVDLIKGGDRSPGVRKRIRGLPEDEAVKLRVLFDGEVKTIDDSEVP